MSFDISFFYISYDYDYSVNLEIFNVDKFLANCACSAFAKKFINNKKKLIKIMPKAGL